MILYQLHCRDDHEFEAWFRDSSTYDDQCAAGKIECPFCGDVKIEKAPMAPRLAKSRANDDTVAELRARAVAKDILKDVQDLCEKVEENCDYVGEEFAEEARRIHHGEAEERGIYGEATEHDVIALEDEDIKFVRIPWLPKRTN